MTHFTLVKPDGNSVLLDSASRVSFTAEDHEYGGIMVTLEWDLAKLRQRDMGAVVALRKVWPNKGAMLTADEDGAQTFQGDVVRVSQSPTTITLAALEQDTLALAEPMTIVATADTDGYTVEVLVDNHELGPVRVDFGDGSGHQLVALGDGETVTRYRYTGKDTYTITATDAVDRSRAASTTVTVPSPQ